MKTLPENEENIYTGACRFCGTSAVFSRKELPEELTGEIFEEDEIITQMCDCYKAKEYQRVFKAKKKLREMIVE